MRILDDGTVEITNKRTRETKIVQPNDLPNYGIPYSKFQTEREAYQKIQEPAPEPGKPKLTGQAATDMNLARGVIDTSRIAEKGHKAEYTGFLDAILGYGRIKGGGPGAEEEAKFRQNIASVRTAIRSYISGKQVTPTEAKEFRDLIPNIRDSDAEIVSKLEGLRDLMGREVQYILDSAAAGVSAEDYLSEPVTKKREEVEIAPTPTPSAGPTPTPTPGPVSPMAGGLPPTQAQTPGIIDQWRSWRQQTPPTTEERVAKAIPGALKFLFPRVTGQLKQAWEHPEESFLAARSPGEFAKRFVKQTVPGGAELAAWALPTKELGLIKGGAVSGGMWGLTSPEELTAQERLKKGGAGAIGGALTGIVLTGAGKVAEKVAGSAKRLITQVFKPSTKEVQNLRKFHGLEFADEVINRDLPSIKGKGNGEILDYYNSKVGTFQNAADEFLSKADKTIDKLEIEQIVNKELQKRGAEGRALQKAARSKLVEIVDDVMGTKTATIYTPTGEHVVRLGKGNLDLVTANQLKRDLQTGAKAFYNTKGQPTAQSEAIAGVASNINSLIESKATGVKKINSSVSFYRLAKDSIETRIDQLAKSEGSMLMRLLATGMGGAGLYARQPGLMMAGGAPLLAEQLYRKPEVKTQAASAALRAGQARLPEWLRKLLLIGGGRAGAAVAD